MKWIAQTPNLTDAQLMTRFYEGDRRAFDVLARRAQPSLLHQALSRLPRRCVGRLQTAEDLVQQTLINAALTLDRPHTRWQESRGAVSTWLGTILRNLTASYLRKSSNKFFVTTDLALSGDEDAVRPEDALADHRHDTETAARDGEMLRRRRRAAIERLPDDVREIFFMKLEGKSYREIARRLGIAKSTVSYRVNNASSRLRRLDDLAA